MPSGVTREIFTRPPLTKNTESPAVIVTSEDAGGENVARLLAAGCEAVLYSGLPREDLLHALDTILARRRETLDGRLAAHRQSHEPRLSDYVSESPAMRAFGQDKIKQIRKVR